MGPNSFFSLCSLPVKRSFFIIANVAISEAADTDDDVSFFFEMSPAVIPESSAEQVKLPGGHLKVTPPAAGREEIREFSSSRGRCLVWHLLVSRLMEHLQLIRGQERRKISTHWLIF